MTVFGSVREEKTLGKKTAAPKTEERLVNTGSHVFPEQRLAENTREGQDRKTWTVIDVLLEMKRVVQTALSVKNSRGSQSWEGPHKMYLQGLGKVPIVYGETLFVFPVGGEKRNHFEIGKYC